jgi:uncharacterized membrane protein
MRTENVVLMREARESLNDKWGLAIGAFAIYLLLIFVVQLSSLVFPLAGLLSLLIAGPLLLGFTIFNLHISRGQEANIGQLFEGFNSFGKSLGAYLLMIIFTFLWCLLLIIPGIIAAISYSMTFYILVDDQKIDAYDAIDKSKKMMYGYKWKFFCLQLRFLGWALLCLLTLGIGFFWLAPYIQISCAKFYDDIKAGQAKETSVTAVIEG